MFPFRMKNILIPVDFSRNSANAVKYAIFLAREFKAKLFLFHSFYTPHHSGHLSAYNVERGKRIGTEENIQDMQNLYSPYSPPEGQEVEYLISQFELREELPKIVQNKNIDLIVMGTQGIGWLAGKIFGTNTAWAIENISCPIIAIPEGELTPQIKHITYASEYLQSDVDNLKMVVETAKLFGAGITVFHITLHSVAEEEKALNEFKEKLKKEVDLSLFKFVSLSAANVEHALENYAKQHPGELLVMSAQRRDLYDKVFGKSITRYMAHHLKSAILFFHHKHV